MFLGAGGGGKASSSHARPVRSLCDFWPLVKGTRGLGCRPEEQARALSTAVACKAATLLYNLETSLSSEEQGSFRIRRRAACRDAHASICGARSRLYSPPKLHKQVSNQFMRPPTRRPPFNLTSAHRVPRARSLISGLTNAANNEVTTKRTFSSVNDKPTGKMLPRV